MPQTPESSPTLEELAEQFLDEVRDNKSPSVEDYALKHPQHARDIREIFPAMLAMEGLKQHNSEASPQNLEGVPGQLGDFRILGLLGRGGMGTVYEALQLGLDRKVALKIMAPGLLQDQRARTRFQNETRIAASLEHPGIVSIYAVGEEQGLLYFAMQHIGGLSLAECLRHLRHADPESLQQHGILCKTPLLSMLVQHALEQAQEPDAQQQGPGPEQVLDMLGEAYFREMAGIIHDAARALHFAHGKGVLHRDIKPGNLLLDLEGRVYVADFGLARAMENQSLTRSNELIGTLRYLPPEQFDTGQEQKETDDTSLDMRADIYGLGAVLYEALCLRPAFAGESPSRLMHSILLGRKTPLRDLVPYLPTPLEDIVNKAMALTPELRYATAGDMADDLERFLTDQPPLASQQCREFQPPQTTRSSWFWPLFIVLLLLLAALGWRLWDTMLKTSLQEPAATIQPAAEKRPPTRTPAATDRQPQQPPASPQTSSTTHPREGISSQESAEDASAPNAADIQKNARKPHSASPPQIRSDQQQTQPHSPLPRDGLLLHPPLHTPLPQQRGDRRPPSPAVRDALRLPPRTGEHPPPPPAGTRPAYGPSQGEPDSDNEGNR